jgi:hypothetical protein
MAKTLEILNTVIATHIPSDVMRMPHNNLGYGCCPTAASNDCYLSYVVHKKTYLSLLPHGEKRLVGYFVC